MTKFDQCFEMLLAHEGGFVNHPDDPGGAINRGMTKNTMQQYFLYVKLCSLI